MGGGGGVEGLGEGKTPQRMSFQDSGVRRIQTQISKLF